MRTVPGLHQLHSPRAGPCPPLANSLVTSVTWERTPPRLPIHPIFARRRNSSPRILSQFRHSTRSCQDPGLISSAATNIANAQKGYSTSLLEPASCNAMRVPTMPIFTPIFKVEVSGPGIPLDILYTDAYNQSLIAHYRPLVEKQRLGPILSTQTVKCW